MFKEVLHLLQQSGASAIALLIVDNHQLITHTTLRETQHIHCGGDYETQISSVATASDFDPHHQYRPQQNPSPMYSESTVSDLTLAGDQGYSHFENMADIKPPRPAKRQRVSEEDNSRSGVGGSTDYNNQMKADEGTGSNQAGDASTGCGKQAEESAHRLFDLQRAASEMR